MLVEGGLSRENLRLVACGDHDRVVTRTFDREQDRANQRVGVVVTNRTIGPDPYAKPADEPDGAEGAVVGEGAEEGEGGGGG